VERILDPGVCCCQRLTLSGVHFWGPMHGERASFQRAIRLQRAIFLLRVVHLRQQTAPLEGHHATEPVSAVWRQTGATGR
jgi:hypothetical protein